MSNETVFFILAAALVVIAVVVSFAGLRFQKFPTNRALLVGGTLGVVVLVLATTTFAWRNAEDEQAHHEAELAEAAAENESQGDTIEADEEEGSDAGSATTSTSTTETGTSTTETTTTAGDPVEGGELFNSQGCSGCHTLQAAGSTGTTGPDLDGALAGQTPEFIKTSIVDPNAVIAKGYPPDVMPQNFGDTLSAEQIDSLVAYLVQSTSGGGSQ